METRNIKKKTRKPHKPPVTKSLVTTDRQTHRKLYLHRRTKIHTSTETGSENDGGKNIRPNTQYVANNPVTSRQHR